MTRWYSARIGEGVILDLRTAVFNHVQKMPIAFFTRTRTGALVSRLNNDVIGAQQAFSGTLSCVVTNLVALILTLIVMLSTSWLVTVLAVIMLPIFLVPARRMGSRLAALTLAGFAMARREWARRGLMAVAAFSAGGCLVFVVSTLLVLIPAAAAVATVACLRRVEVRRWFSLESH